ncbi:FAD binding domain protein [Bisporella sp. PMI_857]|nr:FAD binding domain protein [Bisporella sp. PMI_857]
MITLNKVIIIGGGPTGIAAALLLKQNNHLTPVIFEEAPEMKTIGGAIGIPSNGLRLLDRLGVYEELISRGSCANDIVLHSVTGSILGQIDMVSWSKTKTGYGLLKIMRADLMEVLCRAAEKAGIKIHYGKKLVGIQETDEEVVASFSDGGSEAADLLLGCDGAYSSVRGLYVDPETELQYTGISDFYALVPTSDRPTTPGSLHALHATFTINGMFALMHCRKMNDMNYWFFSYAVSGPDADGGKGSAWKELKESQIKLFNPILQEMLAEVGGEWGDVLRDFVTKSKEVGFHPIFNLPLGGPWHKGRCLLLGDAAHAMSPHLSQGVSMALEDVFLFSRLLSRTSTLVIEELFQTYDRNRRPRVEEISSRSKSNGSSRKKTTPWRLWVNEIAAIVLFGLYNFFNLGTLGIGQKTMVYNIEEKQLF